MALFYECMPKCARKLLDTADIVRDAIYRQSGAVLTAKTKDGIIIRLSGRCFPAGRMFFSPSSALIYPSF